MEAARLLWPLLFSRLFEVTTLSGKSIWCCEAGEDRELLLVASMAFTLGCLLARPLPSLFSQLISAINLKGLYLPELVK